MDNEQQNNDVEHQDDGEHQDDDQLQQNDDQEQQQQNDDGEHQGEKFDRPYVDKLRRESSGYRRRATESEQRAEQLARDLFTERVAAFGILADPSDLPFDAELVGDRDGLEQAVRDLVARKPHLRTRRVPAVGIGQGQGTEGNAVSLAAMLRANA